MNLPQRGIRGYIYTSAWVSSLLVHDIGQCEKPQSVERVTDTEIPRFFVCSNQPSRIYCISQRETLSLIKCKFARSANGTYCSTSKLTRDMILKQLHRFRTLILYGIIGSFSSFLDFIIYTLLTGYVGLFYITANCISVLMGITTSFALNRKYNFKVKDKTGKRFFIFLTVGLCGLLMSNLILYVCIAHLQYNTTPSKLLSIILVVFLQFLINKYITFKQTQQPNNG